MWDGRPLPAGATILLHSEQGFGDAIQFVRYVDVVKNANPAAKIVLECPAPLVPLFRTVRGADQLVALGEKPPSYEVHAPLLSLPRVLRTRVETIPADVPYLFADAALVAKWRERLQTIGGFRVGINWHGRAGHPLSQRRDLPLEQLVELAKVANVRLVSLQKGAGEAELSRAGIVHLGDDLDTAGGAFMDTAAVMMNLDLVVTSDTSIAHLAGALGVAVWLGLPFAADWRWLLERSDSPWYPTMRLFRQKSPGDWSDVFRQFAAELAATRR
jgi:ADP-heptose:LPS heptosyltransferase